MAEFITTARRLLIRLGKVLPFILCFIVFVAYVECLTALLLDRFVVYEYFAIPYTPISYTIANVFEYDWMTIASLAILSVSIQTCVWNKLSILYLALQLIIKNYFVDIEVDIEIVYVISFLNLFFSGFFVWKGFRISIK